MWSRQLICAYQPILLCSIAYIFLLFLSFWQLSSTYLDELIFYIALCLVIEWWRSVRYLFSIKGEFALFHIIKQLYWQNERFYIVSPPLLLHPFIVLNLKARKNGKKRSLFLCYSHFKKDDWRTLHFYLQQLNIAT